MRESSEQPQRAGGTDMQEAFGLLYLLVSVHSRCVTPFLRVGFGWEGIGVHGVLVIPFIFVVAAIRHAPEVVWFLPVWLVALVVQRIVTLVHHTRGIRVHSQFEGFPWLASGVFKVSNVRVARLVVEPVICLFAGFCIVPWSEVTAGIVASAALSLVVKTTIDMQVVNRRLRQMRDAQIEQSYMAERFRDGD